VSVFAALSASATSAAVRPVAISLAGSSTTSIARVSLAIPSTRPTPGTRATSGRMT
jgi:hypothetical protein